MCMIVFGNAQRVSPKRCRVRCTFLLILIAILNPSAGSSEPSAPIEPAQPSSLIATVRVEAPLDFCGEAVPLKTPDVRERMEKELLLTLWDRPQVILWFKRSKRYLPLIEKMLQDNNLPEDLKYVAIAESALRPHAGSHKGAIGFWQFTPATGKKYGLKINSQVDERRNIFRSTRAAIDYFKELHDMLASWTLSAAAYNMGEQGLSAEILAQKTNDYYQLYLPLETQRYVFRILAAKLIFSDPERYGFRFRPEDFYPPLQFDRIQLDCFQETPIHIIAQAAQTYFKAIKDLNPEIRGHYIAAGRHSILIPQGADQGFQVRFEKLVEQWLSDNQERVYVVKQGDSLSAIARRFNVPLPALLIWNRLGLKQKIHPGDKLIIYPNENETGNSE
ncbi:MAG: transglycosylase SLT domain-containing protein [Desulfobacterales bacterium]|nr:MAG: transglycosylase SLT domain-containing protein [Desulfobacterales bacterium]